MGAVLRRAAFSPNIKERADCSAALFTPDGELLVQAEHIPVHLGSMPASVRGGDRRLRRRRSARRPGRAQRPLRRRHPPQRRHAGGAVLRGRPAGRLGGQPGPPRRRGRRRARVDPGRRHRDLPGGPAHPAHAPRRRPAPAAAGQLPHARRAGRRPRRPGRRQRASASSAWRSWPEPARRCAEVVDYGERRMRAALGRPARRHVAGRGRARLDRRRRRPAAPGPGGRGGHGGGRRGHRSTSPARPRRPGATSTPSRRSRCRPCRSPCGRPSIPPSRPTAAPCGRCGSWPRRARSWRPAPPAAVGAGNVEVSQRVADVCLAALAQALPGPGARRRPGHDEQRADRRGEGWVYYETVAGGQGGRPDAPRA